ncbi:hypothetical protein [Amycolatopsis pithecellobii]|uniref:Uncharacterized protein n=1 Tax=Amycolatopsis pithecellobii TaxID=664692 RepID=A0A6N7Z6V7_9PSEU|nr:hypothetical protein [Amycolatopsis pithecellobii]MTD57749.1 hypothetical protein [Amycolatopsis pithecellobii]
MTFSVGGLIGLIILLPTFVWIIVSLLHQPMFRYILLPALARENGWLVRKSRRRAPRDLPGDGTQSWEVPLPDTVHEFLGRYRGRPVHGVEVRVSRKTEYSPVSESWESVTHYSVVTVAMSDRPFDGFHDRNRVAALNGDPMALYPDFADWARNRKPEHNKNVRQDGYGFRSISWRGGFRRKRILRALDELTADA